MSDTEPKEEQKTEDKNAKFFRELIIPNYILAGESIPEAKEKIAPPRSPMLIFVNKNSGAQLGSTILTYLQSTLNSKQVFELPKEHPNEVLVKVNQRLEKLISEGDDVAAHIRANLRIVVAGGDGTHGWLLATIIDLKASELPPVATIPLGTGNNLPFSFGWGKKNPGADAESIHRFLLQAVDAKPMPIDRWQVVITMSKPVEDSPLKVDHPIEKVPSLKKVPQSSESQQPERLSYQGSLWNYLSIGMDAQVSYGFHTRRKNHPERFKNQFMNQTQYASMSCTQGWFCASCSHPKSRNIKSLATVYIAKHDDKWQQLDISPRIRSLVLLNLPSFSGGLNPWGDPGNKKSKKRGLTAPFVNDGLIEIVGFRDAWHGLTLLLPKSHGTRLAQAHKVKIKFENGATDHTYMRVDGEPWLQPLPASDQPTMVEISHNGQAVVLATSSCLAQCLPSQN